jgi:hypothetical protein
MTAPLHRVDACHAVVSLLCVVLVAAIGCESRNNGAENAQPPGTTLPEESPFVGILDGFEFGDQATLSVTEMSSKCLGAPVEDGGEREAESSLLNFNLTYQPSGLQPGWVATSSCLDEVFLVSKQFTVDGVADFQVLRTAGRAYFHAIFTREQMAVTTLGGRHAIVTDQVIYMRDGVSAWYLFGRGVSKDALRDIAAGLR